MFVKEKREQVLCRAHISGRLWNTAASSHLALLIARVQAEIRQCSVLHFHGMSEEEGKKKGRRGKATTIFSYL